MISPVWTIRHSRAYAEMHGECVIMMAPDPEIEIDIVVGNAIAAIRAARRVKHWDSIARKCRRWKNLFQVFTGSGWIPDRQAFAEWLEKALDEN